MGYRKSSVKIVFIILAFLALIQTAQAKEKYRRELTIPLTNELFQAEATVNVPMLAEETGVISQRNYIKTRFPGTEMPRPMGGQRAIYKTFVNRIVQRSSQNPPMTPGQQLALFPAVDYTGYYPADCSIAAGPNHLVAMVNTQIEFFTKAGSRQFSVNLDNFFSGLAPFRDTYDPKCLYDQYTGRFFIMILADDTQSYPKKSWILLAVSDDDNPNGTWTKWALDATLNGDTASGFTADYPGFGVDSNSIIVTVNMWSSTFEYGKVRVIPKQQLLNSSTTVTYTDFWNLVDSDGYSAYTLQPAHHFGSTQYAYVVDNNNYNTLNVYRINTSTTPMTMTQKAISVPTFNTYLHAAVQKGTTTALDTNYPTVLNSVWRNGRLYLSYPVNYGSQVGSRWHQVYTANWTSPYVEQTGTTGETGSYHFYPAIAVNSSGTVALGFTRSSANEYASMYYTYRLASDASGTLRTIVPAQVGSASFIGNGNNPVRWGDYSGIALDPVDDNLFWVFNMVATQQTSWSTWIQSFSTSVESGSLTGNIKLRGRSGPGNVQVTFKFYDPSTQALLFQRQVSLPITGSYQITSLTPSAYKIVISADGWRAETRSGISVNSNTVLNAALNLQGGRLRWN